jgi:rhamnogalacturonan acetylesterase
MKSSPTFLFFAMAATTWAAPALEERATPKIYLAGDSTMAPGDGGEGTNGTPHPSPPLSIPINPN